MRFLAIILCLFPLLSEAEVGIDVGFKYICNQSEGLKLTSYIGSLDSAKNDPKIVMERETKSCRLGKHNYEFVLKHHEAREGVNKFLVS
ncbi:hypothetical protein [Endozoicomonas arenosclerae]|uniref:hypothetical protein n=1 Tax=Endozoicomonas arenosclerae TaxID=1633495 RepID=UPI000B2A94AA|nr:hypothetical protein [Endozoicomonas arenosclerae]